MKTQIEFDFNEDESPILIITFGTVTVTLESAEDHNWLLAKLNLPIDEQERLTDYPYLIEKDLDRGFFLDLIIRKTK